MPQQVLVEAPKRIISDKDEDDDDEKNDNDQDLLLVSANKYANSRETTKSDSIKNQPELLSSATNNNIDVVDNEHHQKQQVNINLNSQLSTNIITNANSINTSETNNYNNNNNNNNSINKDHQKKLNGLKNRIIQRPPPLILDKVSNFYDTTTSQKLNETKIATNDNNDSKLNNYHNLSETTTKDNNNTQEQQPQQQTITANITSTTTNNNANSKFWASLNQNAASRTKQQQQQQTTGNNTKNNNNYSSNQDISKHSSNIDSPNSLGADLIITHRNQSTTLHHNRLNNNNNNNNVNQTIHKSISMKIESEKKGPLHKSISNALMVDDNLQHNLDDSTGSNKLDVSNNSEIDDALGGNNESGGIGGNLIGVENLTPPASDNIRNMRINNVINEPPVSATSIRPRSNNPFLEMDDEELQSNDEKLVSRISDNNNKNFHMRPASFIAATDATTFINQQRKQLQQQTNFFDQNSSYATNATSIADSNSSSNRHLVEQFHNMNINDSRSSSQTILQQQEQQQAKQLITNSYIDQRDSISIDQKKKQQLSSETMGSIYGELSNHDSSHNHKQLPYQPTYIQYGQNPGFMEHDPTINVDSESAVSNPPPSATMQLPFWTDAIYQLNNAILDKSSVTGGAENGQFIYIVESGDIILELDRIKVSGFTLLEFSELLESKSIHLLSAVQTKHCQGLTIDLKQYLNSSFPKNSMDKELQNLIRENIYRRTIPCTTRPPREGEVDKVNYHFLSKEQFVEMNNRGMLLECGMYGGHYYGTMRPLSDLDSLTIYGSLRKKEISAEMRQPLNESHPAIGLMRGEAQNISISQASVALSNPLQSQPIENPLYENHDSLRLFQNMTKYQGEHPSLQQETNSVPCDPNLNTTALQLNQRPLPPIDNLQQLQTQQQQQLTAPTDQIKSSSIVAVDTEALPQGWERVIDETHGTYYIDHNTQRTQYERPYEIELTKGSMGFGFTLLEAENGVLLVRSVIPGGPAHLNGAIRPGDILISAVGISVAGLQHTDVARLFSMFAVGDRVRLTLARSAYVVDANLVPDEYLFSNGTNGDLAIAVNSNYYNQFDHNNPMLTTQNSHIIVDQEFDYIDVKLKRGNQGFGFQINQTIAGQKVGKIHDSETCSNLKQGDILIKLNNQDITKLSHNEVVELLKNCPPGQDVSLIVKRRKRFRSKTPMAMHTQNINQSFDMNQPLRNCKTPSLDGLMYYNQQTQLSSMPSSLTKPVPVSRTINSNLQEQNKLNFRPPSISNSDNLGMDNMTTNSVQNSEASLPPIKFANINSLSQMNQYNNFMNNDKFIMMQMQRPNLYQHATSIYQPQSQPIMTNQMSLQNSSEHYNQTPLYSNGHLVRSEEQQATSLPIKPTFELYQNHQIQESPYDVNYQNNYYANNEEIALQQVQYNVYNNQQPNPSYAYQHHLLQQQPQPIYGGPQIIESAQDEIEDYEYHQINLTRASTDSNWGIRLMGGSEVGRAISIGSIVFGGAASKNGQLKSGDEIISINDINVVGATHQYVVELISACSNRASLMIRRKKFADACEVVLNRNMDEGFGFVIISSGNCTLIGKIIEGSPADRCHQLHVKDRIIAVNGRLITPRMQHPDIVNMIKECGSTLRLRIIPADCYTVELFKNAPNDNFGFSMRGGSEYHGTPLYILRVAPNGLARDSLNVGDQIIEINGIPTVGMTHQQAATIIKYSDPTVKLKLRRNYVTPPVVLVDSPRALQEFNQVTAEMKTVNQNPTPNYSHDGISTTSITDHGFNNITFIQQHNNQPLSIPPPTIESNPNQQFHQSSSSSLPLQHEPHALSQDTNNGGNMIYNQSMPLYAS